MSDFLKNCRGAATFAVLIALVPLIGAVALGAEAASWYVTKQHAQDAADAAAYSGALKLACGFSSACDDTQTVDYRGKEFAAQNGYCNNGDTTTYPGSACKTLPTGTTQSVAIATLTTWNGAAGHYVQATVSQTQATSLAAVLGVSTVSIGATAVARVNALAKPPCILALVGSVGFQGSPNVNAPNCGIASDDTATNALDFTGGGMTIDVGSLSAAGGCSGAAKFCSQALTYRPPITNPFADLDNAIANLCGSNPSIPTTCGLSACTGTNKNHPLGASSGSKPCVNDNVKTTGNTAATLSSGVYFISGTLTLTGGSSIDATSGATFILLPGAKIDTSGGGTLSITAPTSAPSASSLPSALQSDASLFQYMALYQAPCTNTASCSSANSPRYGGNSNITIVGNMYAPTANVTFQGDPTLNLGGGNECGELVASSIAFNGNASFDDSGTGCGALTPSAQFVQLVQ